MIQGTYMNKRKFLKASALAATASALPQLHKPLFAQNLSGPPYEIVMGGYGPSTTGFSAALREVGSHLENVFGDEVDVRYVYNIMDLGYQGSDILWLVENGLLTLGYQSSSYMTNRVQELMIADLPFLFNTGEDARNAMDGDLGSMLTNAIENNMNYRILGYFENGFRHISNRLRPIHSLEDLADLHIRVLPSQILYDTFVQLGANPEIMDLSDALRRIPAGLIDAQENPLANTVTYGIHNYHKFHTITNHAYLSRPIFFHKQTFDSWPIELQEEMQNAITNAVAYQRNLHDEEELDAARVIEESGGEIITLTGDEIEPFRSAIEPLYSQARDIHSELLISAAGI